MTVLGKRQVIPPWNLGVSLNVFGPQHMAIGHPDLRCEKCERQFETVEAVRNHYFASPVHPECTSCNRGFKDDVQYNAV